MPRLAPSLALFLILPLFACDAPEPIEQRSGTLPLAPGAMIIYAAGEAVDADDLVPLGPPASLGGTVLDGDPQLSARIDLADGSRLAGVFQATTGAVLIDFPFTEHATILAGQVALTDEYGNHSVLKPGDSYLITQGSKIVWDVDCARVQKSFFNRVDSVDAPGPMRIYTSGSKVDDDDLIDLGPPEALGGVVISGDPAISARVDLAAGDGLLAGIFQATRGVVDIHFPFTEHATITTGKVTLTDELGDTRILKPGDSYLIAQDSQILWKVKGQRVQKTFFNITDP
jgi:hypothetical protein